MFENWNELADWIKALVVFWGFIAPPIMTLIFFLEWLDRGKK